MLDGLQNQVDQQWNVVVKPPPHRLSQIQNLLEPPLKTRIRQLPPTLAGEKRLAGKKTALMILSTAAVLQQPLCLLILTLGRTSPD